MPVVMAARSHDVWQVNVNILQHLQSDHRSGASTKLFINLPGTDSIYLK